MKENKDTEVSEKLPSTILCLIYIIGGIVAIKFGGDFVVDNASDIALVLGMSETLVGLTIVSIGTSLPELVTSIVAAKKGETALAVGNVVGSNIFNILLILGVSSVICPIAVAAVSFVDICIVALVSIFTFLVAYSKNEINRKEGFMMVTIYIIYMLYAIFR